MKPKHVNLVADIGGTNLRIGISDHQNNITNIRLYECAQYSGLQEIITDYIDQESLSDFALSACFAIACPVHNDLITMTNLPWSFSQLELKKALNLVNQFFINDYTAIAYAVTFLNDDQKVKIGDGEPLPSKPISICGPGTGLGVANLIFEKDNAICLSGEGGHVDFAPTSPLEIEILQHLSAKYEHVSYEQLLSGLGIEQIYQALTYIRALDLPILKAADISKRALNKECDTCYETLLVFCRILGAFAGNLSLTLGSFGGVYIAGGIVPRFIDFLKVSEFRNAFEHKGRFKGFNCQIPTYVITESQPGLLGASAYINQKIKI